jgi:uridine kinase
MDIKGCVMDKEVLNMSNKPFILAVNAISGGGKTTIVKELQRKLPKSKALFFDDRNYDSDSGIEDICKWIEEGADVNKFNLDLLAEDIEKLIKENLNYIIMDYPFGYRHKTISKYLDFSIFIDTPLDIALARRIIRDYSTTSIQNVFDDMRQYLIQGRKAYLYGLDETKEKADYVIDGSKSLDGIVSEIMEKLIHINPAG